jgi:hypothetical protein
LLILAMSATSMGLWMSRWSDWGAQAIFSAMP